MELSFNVSTVRKTELEKSRDARDNFLKISYLPNFIMPDNYKSKYFIYIIKNLANNKIYVGKCKNIYDRANNYIWHYNNPQYNDFRPIHKAIRSYGIDKFVMYPIEICDSKEHAGYMEHFYITTLHTTDRSIGYNVETNIDNRKSIAGKEGHEHSIETKIKKGKPVLCINPETKIAFVAVGMKIFADYMNTSKDLIKNCARKPCMYKGYYIIYLNDADREEVLQKAIKREEAQIAKFSNYYNTYGEAPLSKLPAYIEMVQCVERFMDNPSEGFFTNEGYDAHVLTYETDPSHGRTYRLDDINTFFNS